MRNNATDLKVYFCVFIWYNIEKRIVKIPSILTSEQLSVSDFCSSGMLRSIHLCLLTDVSGQPMGPIFKEQAVQE